MYNFTDWRDHVTSPSNCFNIVKNADGTYTITRAGEIMQQGTPMDQIHFNNSENGIVDAHIAELLLLNYARQLGWNVEDVLAWIRKVNAVYIGTVDLENAEEYPFNSSEVSVSIGEIMDNQFYDVETSVVSFDGNVGDVVVSEKLVNGFKIAFTGSAKRVTIKYTVIGGFMK